MPRKERNLISDEDIIELITKQGYPANRDDGNMIGDRKIHYEKSSGDICITLFEGGHEQLVGQAIVLLPIEY
ncbi:MAG: hypothetical protein SNI51_02315 [Rikenellaceae bacterium]